MIHIQKVVKHILVILLVTLTTTTFGQLEKVIGGFQFTEGPVWKDGQILFSDIPQNRVYKWSDANGRGIYLSPSGNSNGLALDLDGNLLLAQHGNRRVAMIDSSGNEIALATHYDGKRLNSPNDIAVKSDGSIFFTDPPYGTNGELGYYGIYRINKNGDVQLLDKSLYRPNGITFSFDEKILYVTDAEARDIYMWDVVSDTAIENKRLFVNISSPDGYADGLKVNSLERVFITGPKGVHVYESDGTPLEVIEVPGQTSNCNWGGEDGKTLYITSGEGVYRYRSEITGVQNSSENENVFNSFTLHNNYPNPFNPSTTISYTVPKTSEVQISIYNMLGQKVDELVNEVMDAGTYNISWDAKDLSSGIYITLLKSNSTLLSKEMILLK